MKRCLYFFVYSLLGLMLVVGCSGNSDEAADWESSTYGTVDNLDGVSMTVMENSVTSTGLTLLFENTSDEQFTYGEPFLLEKKREASWYQVPIAIEEDYGFNDIGYELEAEGQSESVVDWEWLYGSLESGEYRIVKDMLHVREPGDYDTYHLTAEFTIE